MIAISNHEHLRTILKQDIGFSMVDLLVSLSIMAIVVAIAIPQYSSIDATFNRMNAMTYLVQDLKRAQAEALTQGCREIFSIAPDGKSYQFGCDYLPYDQESQPQPDIISGNRQLPKEIVLETSSNIIFNSQGYSVDETDVMLNVTILLKDFSTGTENIFLSAYLLGTGLFTIE